MLVKFDDNLEKLETAMAELSIVLKPLEISKNGLNECKFAISIHTSRK